MLLTSHLITEQSSQQLKLSRNGLVYNLHCLSILSTTIAYNQKYQIEQLHTAHCAQLNNYTLRTTIAEAHQCVITLYDIGNLQRQINDQKPISWKAAKQVDGRG